MLSGNKVPRYGQIIKMLSDAIDEITQNTEQTQFEWLLEADIETNWLTRLASCKIF